jgi:hypothetical protein
MIVGCPCWCRLLAIVIPVARMIHLGVPNTDKDDMDDESDKDDVSFIFMFVWTHRQHCSIHSVTLARS